MYGSLCIAPKIVKNSFTLGCKNLRKSTITDHIATNDHQLALKVQEQVKKQQTCTSLHFEKQEKGMAEIVRAVHFIVQQDLQLSKFGPLLELLKESGSPYLEHTKLSERILFEKKV